MRQSREGHEYIDLLKRKRGHCECGCGRKVVEGMEFLFDFDHKDPSKKFRGVTKMARYSRLRIRKETDDCALKYCTCHKKTTEEQVATKRGDREQALAEMREAKAAVAASGGDNYPGCSLCGLPDHKRRACPSRTTALVPEAAVLAASPAPKDETPRKTAEVSAKRQKTC